MDFTHRTLQIEVEDGFAAPANAAQIVQQRIEIGNDYVELLRREGVGVAGSSIDVIRLRVYDLLTSNGLTCQQFNSLLTAEQRDSLYGIGISQQYWWACEGSYRYENKIGMYADR